MGHVRTRMRALSVAVLGLFLWLVPSWAAASPADDAAATIVADENLHQYYLGMAE